MFYILFMETDSQPEDGEKNQRINRVKEAPVASFHDSLRPGLFAYLQLGYIEEAE
jgi:hypothetical protein